MARFTSIGMPRKTFVASAAEEAQSHDTTVDAGPSKTSGGDATAKKRKRRGTRGKVVAEGAESGEKAEKKGWGRDPNVAKRAKLSKDHATQRREKRQHERNTGTTCFACRSVGHAARDCPNVLLASESGVEGAAALLGDDAQPVQGVQDGQKKGMKRKQGKKGGDIVGGRCYRCNEMEHSLGACPTPVDPTNPTPYATCYICLGTGHLSSLCPSNPGRGIYVNGGCCKVCKSTAHRAKDCPEESEARKAEFAAKSRRGEIVLGSGNGRMGADEDDFMVDSRDSMRDGRGQGKRGKHAPNNNGVRGLYRGKQRDQPVEGAGEEPPAHSVAAPAPVKVKKVVAF